MSRLNALSTACRVGPVPHGPEKALAEALEQALEEAGETTLCLPSGERLPLPASLTEILTAGARHLSAGRGVTVLATETRLTPREVAEVLGLSRPFVVRLLDAGDIPSEHLPGSRNRTVALKDVLEFQDRRERRRRGRQEIARAVEDAGLPY